MATTTKTIAPLSVFDELGSETPEQVLERLQRQRLATGGAYISKYANANRKQQIGASLGTILGMLFGARGDMNDPEYRRAQATEAINAAFAKQPGESAADHAIALTQDQEPTPEQNAPFDPQNPSPALPGLGGGTVSGPGYAGGQPSVDPAAVGHTAAVAGGIAASQVANGSSAVEASKAQLARYDAAIQTATKLGQPSIARALNQERNALAVQLEQDAANLDKLYADAGQARASQRKDEAQTAVINEYGGEPKEAQQLILRRNQLNTRLANLPEGSPAADAIKAELDDNRKMLDKLEAITGRTEQDLIDRGDMTTARNAVASNTARLTVMDQGGKVIDLLRESPAAQTTVNGLFSLGNTLVQNAKAIGLPVDNLPSGVTKAMQDANMSGTRAQALFTLLAYEKATEFNGKRLSDADFANIAPVVGKAVQDPKVAEQIVRDVVSASATGARNEQAAARGILPRNADGTPRNVGYEDVATRYEEFQKKYAPKAAGKAPSDMTDEELDAAARAVLKKK